MHPVDHARSTAVWLELPVERWPDFLAPHHWMDATKASYARIQHRSLRHHREGVELLVKRMGSHIQGACLREVLYRHLFEDTSLGRLPLARDWMEVMNPPAWMPVYVPHCQELSEESARQWGGSADDWMPLHAWFLETMGGDCFDDNRWLMMRHHAWGAFDCEEEFGPVFNGIPTRVIAEVHIRKVVGSIRPASDWLSTMALRSWMSPSAMVRAALLRNI